MTHIRSLNATGSDTKTRPPFTSIIPGHPLTRPLCWLDIPDDGDTFLSVGNRIQSGGMVRLLVLVGGLWAMAPATAQSIDPTTVKAPAAITAEGVPPVSAVLAERTRPYLESRAAVFQGWNPQTKAALITTRFGNTAQVHEVAIPGGDRRQLSFESDRIAAASYSRRGDVLVVQKDIGGDEFFQLFTLAGGRLSLLTDGKSRNDLNAWSHDGRWLAYTSTRRDGADADIYVMNPRDPKTDRLVARVQGGGWQVADFSPDGSRALVLNNISAAKSDLWVMDVASGTMRPLGDHGKTIAHGQARFSEDGTIWATSDEGADVQRLGNVDPVTGGFTPVADEGRWDVENFDVSVDGKTVAFTTNEAGVDRLRLLDTASRKVRVVNALPVGVVGSLKVAPWGDIGLSLTSARSALDLYSVDPTTLKVTRWTTSETGGLDPTVNVEPQLVEIRSFDGTPVSGFLYRPDPTEFPGRRPLIIDIHGGPESQALPVFLGRTNYLLNELGIAIFRPNVRGSSGYGKRFLGLDDGPFKREDSVKDIGAFLDRLAADPGLDPKRIAETGGSYGGYMCYASAIRYGARLKAASCIVAISNFVTFLENTQSYRRDLRRVEYGDERDPVQRAKLLAISPLTHARDLKIPLMVTTGGNDPRVPPSEAKQMVEAVKVNGVPVWSMVAADEGHGYAKQANVDYQFWATVLFWQKTLLGDNDERAPSPRSKR